MRVLNSQTTDQLRNEKSDRPISTDQSQERTFEKRRKKPTIPSFRFSIGSVEISKRIEEVLSLRTRVIGVVRAKARVRVRVRLG